MELYLKALNQHKSNQNIKTSQANGPITNPLKVPGGPMVAGPRKPNGTWQPRIFMNHWETLMDEAKRNWPEAYPILQKIEPQIRAVYERNSIVNYQRKPI